MAFKNALEIIYLPATAIKPSPHASRQHSSAQRRKLKSILRRFGQVVPLPVDATTGALIDGHAVFDTLVELGHDEIAVVRLKNRSEAEIRALRLALNRVSQDAVWDDEKLRGEFEYLISAGFDLDLSGFEAVEIDMTLSIGTPTPAVTEQEGVEDMVPAGGAPVAQPGDVFNLGPHKVGCGDARDAVFISALASGKSAKCVFSDVAYNVSTGGLVPESAAPHGEFVIDTHAVSRDQLFPFLGSAITAMKSVLLDGAVLYLCSDWRHADELREAAVQNGLDQKNLVVWVKSNACTGDFYRSQHELIHVYKYGEGTYPSPVSLGAGSRNRSNVWQYRNDNASAKGGVELLGVHPTGKPIAMIADALRDVTRRGELVLDVFLASGSVLIAAEETGRVCIGVEQDPAYVDVAIRRWQKRTGKDAVHAVTGETFNVIAERTALAAALTRAVMDGAAGSDVSNLSAALTNVAESEAGDV